MERKTENVLKLRPVKKGRGCEYCNYTGKLLYFYKRAFGHLPANAVQSCPKCTEK